MTKKSYLQTDLFQFAYVPDWYDKLAELAETAIQELWRFKRPHSQIKNAQTPILERYIREVFMMQATAYNGATDEWEGMNAMHISQRCACFHTGLFTREYKPIYACFEPSRRAIGGIGRELGKTDGIINKCTTNKPFDTALVRGIPK